MHFTYESPPYGDDLRQGDVLRRTPALNSVLKEVHPHYINSDYPFFLILTQSCDLFLRKGEIKTRYISICAVRPLQLVLNREVDHICYSAFERIFRCLDDRRKEKMRQFMERLFNNNDTNHFFLSAEPQSGLDQNYCAFLRLSIALKAENHYSTLREAKILQLKESFQHKLGYLVGTMYSRVGTEDWSPDTLDRAAFNQKVDQELKRSANAIWLPDDIHKKVALKLKEIPESQLTEDLFLRAIEDAKQEKNRRKKELLEAVGDVLRELGAPPDLVSKAPQRLENFPRFKANFK